MTPMGKLTKEVEELKQWRARIHKAYTRVIGCRRKQGELISRIESSDQVTREIAYEDTVKVDRECEQAMDDLFTALGS